MALYLVYGIGIVVVILAVLSFSHHKKQESFLKKTLNVDSSLKEKIASQLGIETVAVTAISTFDVLYNTLKMNPFALSGMDHLHHAKDFSNLGDLTSFMRESITTSEQGTSAWKQMIHKYKGYTGEEVAIDKLIRDGHDVQVPESATQEGYDVIVDGTPINIKITDNPKYIQSHLSKYPDIPVLTNEEMSNAFRDNPNVLIDSDLSVQDAFHTTESTFEGITDLGDLFNYIPIITLTISTVKNTRSLIKRNKDIPTALEHIICDTAAVGIGGYAGSQIGLAIGLSLAPATGGLSAIIIPSAATLIGSLAGIFTGKGIIDWFKKRHLRKAVENLKIASNNLQSSFLSTFNDIIHIVSNFYSNRCSSVKDQLSVNEGFLNRFLFPDTKSKFYQMAINEIKKEKRHSRHFYKGLRIKVKNSKDGAGGLLIYAQGKDILLNYPILFNCYDEVERAVAVVEKEKKKFKL